MDPAIDTDPVLATVALDAALEALAPRLLRYCRGLAGERALAEEAAQDALTALVQRWRRHGPPDDPAAFAFVVARRRLARRRWRARLLAPLDGLFERRADDRADPEARALERDALAAALAALARLPKRDREALLLVAAGELDVAAAARVLGIGRSALKMRVHRARKRLRAALGGTDLETPAAPDPKPFLPRISGRPIQDRSKG